VTTDLQRAEIVVDLAAIRHNVRVLRDVVGPDVAMMTVVKADGYGHGMAEVATAARAAGADWLGVATPTEALALRAAGDSGPLLCWLYVPGEDLAPLVRAGVDVTASSVDALEDLAAVGGARVQLKVDTGLNRGGAPRPAWPELMRVAADLERRGRLTVTGIWSHLVASDEPDHPANQAQEQVFEAALAMAEEAGLRPGVRHLANSAAALLRPSSRYDMVRCGIASYGLDPAPGVPHGTDLVPGMTVRARLAMVKEVAAGEGVSYGYTWVADHDTTVGLVPVGYAEGVPRAAGNLVDTWVAGRRRPVRGRVCMDQLVVDLDGDHPPVGSEVVLFGNGEGGAPTALDWATRLDTITYEIATRVGGRLVRRHVDTGAEEAPA